MTLADLPEYGLQPFRGRKRKEKPENPEPPEGPEVKAGDPGAL